MANGKQYSRQELQEILDVALSKQSQPGDFGEAELLETARDPAARAGKVASSIEVWKVDPALVAALAENQERRQKWSVTIVGDHLYIEVDGVSRDGAVERTPLAAD